MVSTPSVDPLDTSGEQRDGAFINRCISAAFTPGSIFKLITAAAAIERIPDIDSRRWYCEDEFKIAGVGLPTEKGGYVLVVPTSSGIATLDDFIAKAKETELRIGIETGGSSHRCGAARAIRS